MPSLPGLVAPGGYLILDNHRNPRAIRCLLLRLAGRPLPAYHGRPLDLSPSRMRQLLKEKDFRLMTRRGIGLGIVQAALQRTEVLPSRWAQLLEPLSRLPG